ncbi:hypothetical protein [Sabulibacter ruber]|uniref:hypothetical protein n=1 Tax=Sabulibacter ruber TaxID=2811901 RepID=UPI001A96E580|nr:hypothetical protein [Sabulibacter ruber]
MILPLKLTFRKCIKNVTPVTIVKEQVKIYEYQLADNQLFIKQILAGIKMSAF